MGKTKPGYYAVSNGRKKGIYNTWEECKAQVCKYSNARYKKFYDLKQAQNYIEGKEDVIEIDSNKLQVWVDGCSYNNSSKNSKAGIGFFGTKMILEIYLNVFRENSRLTIVRRFMR